MSMNMKGNFINVLREINREGTENLINWLEQHRFFEVPASCKHHNNEQHGLLKHSLEVCNEALYLRKQFVKEDSSIAADLPKESVAIAALLHDVCKWNQFYISPYSDQPKCDKKALTQGHGLKSVRIIEQCGYQLTDDEKQAIWWHMGCQHEPSYEGNEAVYNSQGQSALCRLIRQADYNSTHLKETFEKLLDESGMGNVERMKRYLAESNFYHKGCASHHHYSTGLVAHSIGVCRHILELCDDSERQDAMQCALLHDLADQNRSKQYGGHGYRSMMIAKERINIGASEEVYNMIRFHKNSSRKRSDSEQALLDRTRQIPLFQKLCSSDHFDADHDITDVLKHFRDEVF